MGYSIWLLTAGDDCDAYIYVAFRQILSSICLPKLRKKLNKVLKWKITSGFNVLTIWAT
jgi:hypothetical protein